VQICIEGKNWARTGSTKTTSGILLSIEYVNVSQLPALSNVMAKGFDCRSLVFWGQPALASLCLSRLIDLTGTRVGRRLQQVLVFAPIWMTIASAMARVRICFDILCSSVNMFLLLQPYTYIAFFDNANLLPLTGSWLLFKVLEFFN
jgi:hypothetical protein